MNVFTRLTRGARLPSGLVGMLVLVLAAESFLEARGLNDADFFPTICRHVAKAAGHEVNGREILYLGDSLVKVGVAPRVIEAQIGCRGLNLAINGGQPPVSYYLLQKALKAGARPTAVLVCFKASNLSQSIHSNQRHLSELLSVPDIIEITRAARDATFFGNLLLSRTFPSIRGRNDISRNIMTALNGQSSSAESIIAPLVRNLEVNQGAYLLPPNDNSRTEPKGLSNQTYFPDKWSCDSVNYSYIFRVLKLAAQHDILVFWLLPPIVPSVQARRELMGLDERYLQI